MKDKPEDKFDSLFVKKGPNRFKIVSLLFAVVILGMVAVYGYLSVSAVRARLDDSKAKVKGADAVNPELFDLLKEKAWLESRLKMAAGDSIGLDIDLENNTIQLELEGVVVMQTKIRASSTSGFFRRMDGNIYFSMFGSPLTILSYQSSIAKSPFKVKQAPKNEAEADSMAVIKETKKKEDVYWTVKLDRDIELKIQGIDSISDAQSKYKLGQGFKFNRDLRNIGKAVEQIIHFKKPDYTPEILICIPEKEATAILRALPRKALVTIRI
jgi:hypothetical protein